MVVVMTIVVSVKMVVMEVLFNDGDGDGDGDDIVMAIGGVVIIGSLVENYIVILGKSWSVMFYHNCIAILDAHFLSTAYWSSKEEDIFHCS